MASVEKADQLTSQGEESSQTSPLAKKEDRLAAELASNFLQSLEEPMRQIALHALKKMGDDVSSRAWLDHRIRKPLLLLIEDAQQGKRPSRSPVRSSSTPPASATFTADGDPEANSKSETPSKIATVPKKSSTPRPADQAPPVTAAASSRQPSAKSTAPRPQSAAPRPQSTAPRPQSAAPRPQSTAPHPQSTAPVAKKAEKIEKPKAAQGRKPPLEAPSPQANDKSLSALADAVQKRASEVPEPRSHSSRPPAPPSFQPMASKAQNLSGGSRTSSRPPPPPWRAEGSQSTEPPPVARTRTGDSMPPPPSSRHRELETLIPPVSQSEEDLIEPIVKRLTALRFIESREEAAAFLLEMALDVVPARVGLIHFFDPGPSEFVVAAAVGDRASALESWSTESNDPLLSDALRDKKLVHVTSTKKNPRVQKGRWAIIHPRNAVVCVPCHRAGRRIGAFELVDPHGRTEFARNQLNALTFIAGEFSKFVSEHEPSTAKAAGS